LIANTNFDDPSFARFQGLSASIGRFFRHPPERGVTGINDQKDSQRSTPQWTDSGDGLSP
jgi:hypothetical protein